MNNSEKKIFKIMQILPDLNSGGVENVVMELTESLVKNGFTSIVVSNGGVLVDKLISQGSEHIKLSVHSKNPIKILWCVIRLICIIKSLKVDIIHAHSRMPGWICFFARKFVNVKFVTTFHGTYSINNIFKKAYNSVMLKSDHVIAVSNFIKSHIEDNYLNQKSLLGDLISQDNITIINSGVDLNLFSLDKVHINKKDYVENIREKYNLNEKISNNIPIILMPARMTSWKGHINLINALAKLEKNFYCILVGRINYDSMYFKKIFNLIKQYKLEKKIKCFDVEYNLDVLYALSDIVVSSSERPEAFGRVITEAQAMEKIIITTNIGAAKDNVTDNVTGFHVIPQNPQAMAEKLNFCISILGSERHKNITSAARKNVLEHFSLDLILQRSIEFYETLLSK